MTTTPPVETPLEVVTWDEQPGSERRVEGTRSKRNETLASANRVLTLLIRY